MGGLDKIDPVTISDPAADEALVHAARRGQRAAFEELVRRTARLVYARIYLDTNHSHLSEDLVQETYLLAWRRIAELSDSKAFRAWLLRIAESVVIDAVRRATRRKRSSGSPDPPAELLDRLADARPSPAETAAREEERRRVLSELRDLPEEYRLPLMLRYLAGADYDTIGKQLGLSNGSLRGLLARGLKLLRARMQERP